MFKSRYKVLEIKIEYLEEQAENLSKFIRWVHPFPPGSRVALTDDAAKTYGITPGSEKAKGIVIKIDENPNYVSVLMVNGIDHSTMRFSIAHLKFLGSLEL